ncbi:extracellular solute-binding protein, partial [Falsihalocynthiibacter sp. S25ZX9]
MSPLAATTVFAADLPACENCSDSMTIMSLGGAYQASQIAAYSDPYAALTGITVVYDESSNESIAKMRAGAEAGNSAYDLIDAEGPDSQRACDEGLAIEIDAYASLAAG